MDRETVRIYEAGASAWAAKRSPRRRRGADKLASSVASGAVRIDLGCGPGHDTPELGTPVVAFDAVVSMLALARDAAPDALCVQGDLEALPFRSGAVGGAWARNSYLHVPPFRLPLALADLQRSMAVGAPLALAMKVGDYVGHALPGDDFPGRYFALWDPARLTEIVVGAGFEVTGCERHGTTIELHATRRRTLPDFVGPDMAVLVCGLNPSLRSADVGLGFAGPSNRFWGAAIDAGLVSRARDPWHALRRHGVGMTDLVKRATVGAAELAPAEYRDGRARVEELVRWLAPDVVCFVGLAGFRAAVDRRAGPGCSRSRSEVPWPTCSRAPAASTRGRHGPSSPTTCEPHSR